MNNQSSYIFGFPNIDTHIVSWGAKSSCRVSAVSVSLSADLPLCCTFSTPCFDFRTESSLRQGTA